MGMIEQIHKKWIDVRVIKRTRKEGGWKNNNLLFLQLYGNKLKWLYNLQAKKLSGIN